MESLDVLIRAYGYPALFVGMLIEQFVPPMPESPSSSVPAPSPGPATCACGWRRRLRSRARW
jgi:hypothetical protein